MGAGVAGTHAEPVFFFFVYFKYRFYSPASLFCFVLFFVFFLVPFLPSAFVFVFFFLFLFPVFGQKSW